MGGGTFADRQTDRQTDRETYDQNEQCQLIP